VVDAARNRADAVAQGLPPDAFLASDRSFYTNTTLLVGFAVAIAAIVAALGLLVSLSEAIVSRRRTYAALVASGVPRSVLVRTQLWQTMSMALPALVLAAAVGVELARALFGATISGGGDQVDVSAEALAGQPVVDPQIVTLPKIVYSVPVPWHGLEVVLGGSVAAVIITVGIGLLFLRPAMSIEELRTG
jgi:ABC-type antimicrobial peptide transport system permease subunit